MKVSVIIPNFNRVAFLEEAVESVLQTQKRDCYFADIIIVDDASTEPGARQKILALQQRFPEIIKIYFIEENKGQSFARNLAIEKSSGEIILPLDNDDKISPDYIPRACEVFKNDQNVGIVYARAAYFGHLQGEWLLPPASLPEILVKNVIFNSAFFRKADWLAAGGYDQEMRFWEDWDLWLGIIALGKKIRRLDTIEFYYRQYETAKSVTTEIDEAKRLQGYAGLVRNHPGLYQKFFPDIAKADLPKMLLAKRNQRMTASN